MALFKEGDIIRILTTDGFKPLSERTKSDVKVITELDRLFPLLSDDEVGELIRRMDFDKLADPKTSPEQRREILSRMDECPCCHQWLGHNNPPPDAEEQDAPRSADYRRQDRFKF